MSNIAYVLKYPFGPHRVTGTTCKKTVTTTFMRCTRMLGGWGVAASGVVWLVDAAVSLFPSGVTFLDECS